MSTRVWSGISLTFVMLAVNCGGRSQLKSDGTFDTGGSDGTGGSIDTGGSGGTGGETTGGTGGGGKGGSGGNTGGTGGAGKGGTGGSGGSTGGTGGTGKGGSGGTGGIMTGGTGGTGKGGTGGVMTGGTGGVMTGGTGGVMTGGTGGVGGSAGKGGTAGTGGGLGNDPFLNILPGVKQTPECTACVSQRCPIVSMCSVNPTCVNGTGCMITKCANTGGLQCYIECFNGNIDLIVIGANASQCVYASCGSVCISP